MEFKHISIKSFISDLPRVFNENFTKLADFIDTIYDETKKKLQSIVDIEISGILSANTVTAKNIEANNIRLKIKTEDNKVEVIDMKQLEKRISQLERKVAYYVNRNTMHQ